MRKGGKSRSYHMSGPLNIRINFSLFTRVKGILRFNRSGSPSSLPATGSPWCLSPCQEPVPQLSACPSLSWLARRPCWVWRGPENRATNERPQRRSEEKNPGEMHQNSAESKTGYGLRIGKNLKKPCSRSEQWGHPQVGNWNQFFFPFSLASASGGCLGS